MKSKLYVLLVFLFVCSLGKAQVILPKILSDGAVLQRDTKITIWGWASAGERVTIRFNRKNYKAITGKDGKWRVQLSETKAGGPHTLEITGKNRIVLNDVLVGDVWLCAGQSNMVHQMRLHNILYANEISTANNPEIRQFHVPNSTNLQGPQEDLPGGTWKSANPVDVNEFSAVAYFMAKKLHEKYRVPIGIINASWGGTPIEAWMSAKSFSSFPDVLASVQKNKDTTFVNDANRKMFAWNAALPRGVDKGHEEKWFEPTYVPKEWRKIAVPGYWEDQGLRDLDGVVWYRKQIEVPAAMAHNPAKVFLGRIVDADVVYVNGKQIGSTGYMYPQRRYAIPEGVLKPGKNLFVVRVTNNAGKGGFVPDKPYQLIAGKDTVDLTGYWSYKVGQVKPADREPGPGGITLHYQPTALYNAMLAPIVNFGIKGFAWYQGEANTGKPDEYAGLQSAMIRDWRRDWKQGELPFVFAQLPGFMEFNYQPAESNWAMFREAQRQSLSVSNTAMAVTIDLGEWNDIHPDNKKDVGERLALAAGKIAYAEKGVCFGPLYASSSVEGGKMVLSFDHTGHGLTTRDGEAPQEFAIAGADRKFVWAKTRIEGNRVVVWSDQIGEPAFVRYAWADNPVNPNLINREGLPASPFTTEERK